VPIPAASGRLIIRQRAPGPFRSIRPERIDFIAFEAQQLGPSIRRQDRHQQPSALRAARNIHEILPVYATKRRTGAKVPIDEVEESEAKEPV